MRTRHGDGRWRVAAGAVMSAVLAASLIGAAPSAFAEGEDGASERGVMLPEQGEEKLIESAFQLGDVTVTCVLQDEGAEANNELAVGVPVARVYRVTNEGESAHLRIASSLAYSGLVQANELGVSEAPMTNAMTDGAVDVDFAQGAWRLAADGWWYRGEPLEPGETIAIRVLIEIPRTDAWLEALSTGEPSSVEENMRVEAVQTRNMVIDLAADHPWGDSQAAVCDEEEGERL